MTKKHFTALAERLKATKPTEEMVAYEACLAQWQHNVSAVADVCSAMNPRFDRETFYEACGWRLS